MAKILIIDDEPTIRELLKLQLEKAGHSVLEAIDGMEGQAVAQSQKPDLIFLDGMIPKIDGWHLCKELKSGAATNQIPVVMLTSCDEKIQELRGWESGADSYLTKPWTPDQIREVLTQHLKAA